MIVVVFCICMLIDGQFIELVSLYWQNVVNLVIQDVLVQVLFVIFGEVDVVVVVVKEVFKIWCKIFIGICVCIFLKYQQFICENMSELVYILFVEQGKIVLDVEGDVFCGLEVVEYVVVIGNLQFGELVNNVVNGVDIYILLQLFGVCVGIILFNFLVMILLWMFLMVIVIGNIFILKLFEQDLMVIMCLVELVLEVGIFKGVFNVVYGGEDVVNVICDYLDIKVVFFVGFICVGMYVYNCVLLVGKCV